MHHDIFYRAEAVFVEHDNRLLIDQLWSIEFITIQFQSGLED